MTIFDNFKVILKFLPVLALLSPLFAQDAGLDHFEKKIRPILAAHCFACHSAKAPTPQGGLLLDSSAGLARGGNSGAVIDRASPNDSLLLRAIRHTDKNLKMPPGKALGAEQVADFEVWVKQGSVFPELTTPAAAKPSTLWSLLPPVAAPAPAVRAKSWARSDIDRFILAKLEEKGLSPSPEADRRTLLRRAYFDLTGLPPSAAEAAGFEKDKSPAAYERLIDRLLASPRYGERWGRHWLDIARYADSDNDAVNMGQRYPWSYTYRDWVIGAINEDLPYDRFLLQQLAADRIAKNEPRHLAALGFLSLGREFPKSFPETVDDRIDAVSRGMLGFTVACARCHDHKFDPIPTKDYYSLYSVFSNIRVPAELPLLQVPKDPSGKDSAYLARLKKIREADDNYRKSRNAEMIAFFKTQKPAYLVAAKVAEGRSALEVDELIRERQLNLRVLTRVRGHLKQGKPVDEAFEIPLDEFPLVLTEGDSNNTRDLRVRYNYALAQYAYDGAPARAMAVEDEPAIKPARVFLRGNANNPGADAPPRFLSCIAGPDAPKFREGSGRLDLANAIIDPKNPLTARVAVNRAWMHHFGSGIVRTPSDFGLRGEAPTHPELLDYLAIEFVKSGWSMKKLHRSMMLSATYRQASLDQEAARKIDPDNLLFWRANRQRLDFESLRDSMLMAAGRLDTTMGGPPYALTADPAPGRRTVYGFIERSRLPASLVAFDFASPDQHAPMRFVTTVPQQALFFLNSDFVAEQAIHLAKASAAKDAAVRIRQMYLTAFGRGPTAGEITAGLRFVQSADEPAAVAEKPSPWQYGSGVGAAFRRFETFVVDTWQGAPILPARETGKAVLRAGGGDPGDSPDQPVTRRWVSPISGPLQIEGSLRHNQAAVKYGDGVRARIVSSRRGVLGTWTANGGPVEIKLSIDSVELGEILDFAVDSNQDPERDAFSWAPILKAAGEVWDAKIDFRGPAPKRLDIWARYAQVLLETNEFAFVD